MTVVAGMTAFYMFRLYYVIFWGQSYYELDPENRRKPQEVPFVMLLEFPCVTYRWDDWNVSFAGGTEFSFIVLPYLDLRAGSRVVPRRRA